MPLAVAISNVTPPAGAGAESETVKANDVVPASPSLSETLLIERFGAASSLVIVPVPGLTTINVEGLTLLSKTENVSFVSGNVSPLTSTLNEYVVDPAGMDCPVSALAT